MGLCATHNQCVAFTVSSTFFFLPHHFPLERKQTLLDLTVRSATATLPFKATVAFRSLAFGSFATHFQTVTSDLCEWLLVTGSQTMQRDFEVRNGILGLRSHLLSSSALLGNKDKIKNQQKAFHVTQLLKS